MPQLLLCNCYRFYLHSSKGAVLAAAAKQLALGASSCLGFVRGCQEKYLSDALQTYWGLLGLNRGRHDDGSSG